jgi:uncharacterized protein involved in exopolysaccharide biosynthesis
MISSFGNFPSCHQVLRVAEEGAGGAVQAEMEAAGLRTGPEGAATETPESGEYSLLDILGRLYRRRRLIISITAVGIVLGGVSALSAHRMYAAQVKIVPALFLSSSGDLAAMAQLRSAASQFGMGIGGSSLNPSPLLPHLLGSRDLLVRLLAREYPMRDGRPVVLSKYLEIKDGDSERALQTGTTILRKDLRSSFDMRSGVTTITATFRDPRLAAAVANDSAAELDLFLQGLKNSQAGKKAGFIQQRLTEIKAQLEQAEGALKTFRERNRQTAGSPELQLEEGRLMRVVSMNEQIFITLSAQLETARIDEMRNTPELAIVEKAVPPLGRAGRLRKIATSTLVFGFAGVVAALLRENLGGFKRAIRERQG